MKRFFALLLSLILVFAMLSSCASEQASADDDKKDKKKKEKEQEIAEEVTFENAVEKMDSAFSDIEGYMIDLEYVDVYTVYEEQYRSTTEMSMHHDEDTVKIEGVYSDGNGTDTIDGYMDKNNDDVFYFYEDDEWYCEQDGGFEPELYNVGQTYIGFVKNLNDGEISEEQYKKTDCYKLSGSLTPEAYLEIGSYADFSGVVDVMAEYEIPEDFQASNGQVVVYVNKETFLPMYFTLDLTDMANDVYGLVYSEEDEFVEEECTIKAVYTYDENLEVEIPAEAIEAGEGPSFREILENSVGASEDLENYGIDATAYVDIALASEFLEMTVYMDAERDGDVTYNSYNFVLDSLDAATNMEIYSDYDSMVQYTCTDGVWTVDYLYDEPGSLGMDLAQYMQYMEHGTVDEVVYGNSECYEISGEVEVDFLQLLDDMSLEGLNEELESIGLSEDFLETVFSETVPFTLEFGIDKESYLPIYFEADLTDMMDTYISAIMEYFAEQTGEDDLDAEVQDFRISATYRDYGDTYVEIPYDSIYSDYYYYY